MAVILDGNPINPPMPPAVDLGLKYPKHVHLPDGSYKVANSEDEEKAILEKAK